MRLGVVAATVAGAALIAGGPAAVWLVSSQEYGDNDDEQPRRETALREWREQRPMIPPRRELREDLRDGVDQFRDLAEWSRCVLEKAREADGPFDPDEECGEAPELPRLDGPDMEIPEQPESNDF